MNKPVEFVGERDRYLSFSAGLGVVLCTALLIGVPFSEGFAWGLELTIGALLVLCAAWLAYLLWAPTMRLTITPDAVACSARLTPIRIDRSTSDLLVVQQVKITVSTGRGLTSMMRWKLGASGSPKALLLTQWDPVSVAEACRSNGWQVEWRDLGGQVLPGKG